MIAKIAAVISLVVLPLSIAMWHKSHHRPVQYRYDLTLYKSVWVYMRDGVCALQVLSMPTKTASRSEFRNPLRFEPAPMKGSLGLDISTKGPYRTTWIVFPFWLLTGLLSACGAFPVIRGPAVHTWRRWRGRCVACGYDLTGNRSGRCPECGQRLH